MTLRNVIRAVVMAVTVAAWPAGVSLMAQDSAARAARVLDEARLAIGGAELENVRALRAQGDYRRAMGGGLVGGKLELLLDRAGRLRRDEELGRAPVPVAVRTEVIDGDTTWDDMIMRGPMNHGMPAGGAAAPARPSEEQLRRSRQADLARYQLVWFLATDEHVSHEHFSHAGVAESADGRADVLEIAGEGRTPTRLFIDQRTHLPLMLTWGGREGEREVTVTMYLSDYRKVRGVLLPHAMRRSIDGRALDEWTVSTYDINPQVPAARFRK
jgi:hypothetical protein